MDQQFSATGNEGHSRNVHGFQGQSRRNLLETISPSRASKNMILLLMQLITLSYLRLTFMDVIYLATTEHKEKTYRILMSYHVAVVLYYLPICSLPRAIFRQYMDLIKLLFLKPEVKHFIKFMKYVIVAAMVAHLAKFYYNFGTTEEGLLEKICYFVMFNSIKGSLGNFHRQIPFVLYNNLLYAFYLIIFPFYFILPDDYLSKFQYVNVIIIKIGIAIFNLTTAMYFMVWNTRYLSEL